MTLAIVIVVVAVLALCFIVGLGVSKGLRVQKAGASAPRIEPIDVEAFRNLVDAREDEYLRRRLPPADFRTVQRERLRAMAAYIQVAGRNAAVLIQIGQPALAASDPATAEAARQLVDNALLLRRNAVLALLRIYLALAWPNSGLNAGTVLSGYERLNNSAMLLGRLRNPAVAVRISA